jgi:Protein of unknown function (DUF3313)
MNHISLLLPRLALVAALSCMAVGAAHAADAAPPATSPEGLKLVPSTKVQMLYLREGANFSGYDKFAMLEAFVAFRKNWKLDANEGQAFRVKDSDIARIKADIAQEFQNVFTRELTAKGMTYVTAVGKGVLILRPSIVNLDVVEPETMNSAHDNLSASAGQATLILEVFDSVTSELLARIVDTQAANDPSPISRNAQTNKIDADKILTKWASLLGTALQDARAGAAKKG